MKITPEDITHGMNHFCHVLADSPKFAEYLNTLLEQRQPTQVAISPCEQEGVQPPQSVTLSTEARTAHIT